MILIQARTSKVNLKTLRYNSLNFSLKGFYARFIHSKLPPPPISDKRSHA
nr:type III restriction endonuclease subunit R [Helicobacter pylori]